MVRPAGKVARPSFRFVGGKGGVGKTTCAAAVAVARARSGASVLLASTDPADSLGDVLETSLGPDPTRVEVSPRRALAAVAIEADRALARWLAQRRSALAEVVEDATYLSRREVEDLLDLSFPGVDELMGLMELDRIAAAGGYREVVVDMAPTGHALRLLSTPAALRRAGRALGLMRAKHDYLSRALGGGPVPDAADAVIEELASGGRRLEEQLRDPRRSRFTWVLLPESMAIEETADGLAKLAEGGMTVDELIVNRIREPSGDACSSCRVRMEVQGELLERLGKRFADVAMLCLPEGWDEPRGVLALSKLARALKPCPSRRRKPGRRTPDTAASGRASGLEAIEKLAPRAKRLLLFAGKGGVGKTTTAAAAALALASRDAERRILLLSVDPAHSLADVLRCPLDDRPRPVPRAAGSLEARELDAERGFEEMRDRYRGDVERLFEGLRRGAGIAAPFDRQALTELIDLAPSGLDELVAILTLVDVLEDGDEGYDLAVVDAAPTGHALRLLQMPELALGWARAVIRIFLNYRELVGLGEAAEHLVVIARRMRLLLELLQDPTRSSAVVVTRAAELPLEESLRLFEGLRKAGVSVGAVILNALSEGTCSRCEAAAAREAHLVADYLPRLSAWIPASAGGRAILRTPAIHPPPGGAEALLRWAGSWGDYEA